MQIVQIVRWDPFRELMAIQSRLGRAPNVSCAPRTEDSFGSWAPPVDIFEKNDQLVFRAEIPGVPKEDLNVRVENGVLRLDGERKQGSEFTMPGIDVQHPGTSVHLPPESAFTFARNRRSAWAGIRI